MYSSTPQYYLGGTVAQAPADVRALYIRRVYHVLFASLGITVFTGWVCAQSSVLPAIMSMFTALCIAALIVGIGMSFAQRVSGLNVALLALYSALQGAIIGPLLIMVDHYAPGVPFQAAVLTLAVFGGLSVYVLQKRRDFSYLGGMLFVGLIALLVCGFLFAFMGPSHAVALAYSATGVLIFAGYVLYDTSRIVNRLGPSDVVPGAIKLYLDFINLFLFILRLLSELNRRS